MSECYFCDPPRYATRRVTDTPEKGPGGFNVCEVCADDYPAHLVTRIPYDSCSICGRDIERFDQPLCKPCEGTAKAHAKLDREAVEYRAEAKEWDRRLP